MKFSCRLGCLALLGAGMFVLPSCQTSSDNDFLEEAEVASTHKKPDFMRELEYQDDAQSGSSNRKIEDPQVWDDSRSSGAKTSLASNTSKSKASSGKKASKGSKTSASRGKSTSRSGKKVAKTRKKSTRPSVYTVKKGDNLWVIAKRYNTTQAKIMKANRMKSSMIRPGQKIKLPK